MNKSKPIKLSYDTVADCGLTKSDLRVYLYLLYKTNDREIFKPHLPSLSRELNMNHRTLQRAINHLEEKGYIATSIEDNKRLIITKHTD